MGSILQTTKYTSRLLFKLKKNYSRLCKKKKELTWGAEAVVCTCTL